MNRAAKACITVMLGATLGLKEMDLKHGGSSAAKQNWVVVGSARAQANLYPGAPTCSKDVEGRMNFGKGLCHAEESRRMVLFLSCWGPN